MGLTDPIPPRLRMNELPQRRGPVDSNEAAYKQSPDSSGEVSSCCGSIGNSAFRPHSLLCNRNNGRALQILQADATIAPPAEPPLTPRFRGMRLPTRSNQTVSIPEGTRSLGACHADGCAENPRRSLVGHRYRFTRKRDLKVILPRLLLSVSRIPELSGVRQRHPEYSC